MIKKTFFSITVTALMFIGCSKSSDPASVVPDTQWYTSNPSAGTFTISTANQLAGLAKLVNEGNYFTAKVINLAANINLSSYGASYNGGKGWIPIGNEDSFQLHGTFNGNGHKISGLYINDAELWGAGLFGRVYGTVKNLRVEIAAGGITGFSQIGGITGYLGDYGIIENCCVTGGIL